MGLMNFIDFFDDVNMDNLKEIVFVIIVVKFLLYYF